MWFAPRGVNAHRGVDARSAALQLELRRRDGERKGERRERRGRKMDALPVFPKDRNGEE